MIFWKRKKIPNGLHEKVIQVRDLHHIGGQFESDKLANSISLSLDVGARKHRQALNAMLKNVDIKSPRINNAEIWFQFCSELSAFTEIDDIESAKKIGEKYDGK